MFFLIFMLLSCVWCFFSEILVYHSFFLNFHVFVCEVCFFRVLTTNIVCQLNIVFVFFVFRFFSEVLVCHVVFNVCHVYVQRNLTCYCFVLSVYVFSEVLGCHDLLRVFLCFYRFVSLSCVFIWLLCVCDWICDFYYFW